MSNTPMDQLQSIAERQEHYFTQTQAGIERVREQTRLLSIKYVRLPLLIATLATGLTVGGDQQPAQAPQTADQGFIWHLRHLVIEGLVSGATPDVVNILRQGRIVWQLNGNQFAQTWGRGEMRLVAGELLSYAAVGTLTSKTVIIHGTAEEVASEQEGKFR
jgi:hypothetical protein